MLLYATVIMAKHMSHSPGKRAVSCWVAARCWDTSVTEAEAAAEEEEEEEERDALAAHASKTRSKYMSICATVKDTC